MSNQGCISIGRNEFAVFGNYGEMIIIRATEFNGDTEKYLCLGER